MSISVITIQGTDTVSASRTTINNNFNVLNNEYLKIAMEQTGVRQGKNGFEKDKTPESTEDTADNPDELKTHVTDAWDTLFIGVNFFYSEPTNLSGGILFIGAY